jgi:hypothetical protein
MTSTEKNLNPTRVIQRIDEVLQGDAKSSAVSHIGRALNELAVASMAVEGSPLPATPPTQDNSVAWALHQAQSWAHKAMRELK